MERRVTWATATRVFTLAWGQAERVERVEVLWPDGAVTRLEDLPVDEVVVVKGGDD